MILSGFDKDRTDRGPTRGLPGLRASRPTGGGEEGTVLVMVLWVLVAVTLLALSFSVSIRTEVEATRNVVQQKQAYYLTRAGIEYAVYEILRTQSSFFESQQLQDGQRYEVPAVLTGNLTLLLDDGRVEVAVSDESGKINLNLSQDFLIFNLLIMVGMTEGEAAVIVDSIVDWRDRDSDVSPRGAEESYYNSLDPPYSPKNDAFSVPEELLLVRGVSPQIYYGTKGLTLEGEKAEFFGLQKYFTTFSRGRLININAAPLQVLAAIPDLDYRDALRIDEIRSGAPLQDPNELYGLLPALPPDLSNFLTANRSTVFSLDARGRLTGSDSVSRIRCVVQVDGTGPKGYSVLYWNEANVEL